MLASIRARLAALLATPAGMQAARFARLTLLAGLAIWLAGGHRLTLAAGWAALVGGAETIWRQLAPTVTAPTVTGLPALTGAALDPADPAEGTGHAGAGIPPTDPPAAPETAAPPAPPAA